MLKALLTAACLARALGFAPSRAARFAAPARPAARAAVSMEMGMFEIVAPAIGTAVYAVGFNLLKDDEPAEAIDDKKEVEAYFNDATEGGGFDRWNRIYSESDDVNKVQLEIRSGHQQTIDKVLEWVDADKSAGAELSTVADVGCGVGSLSLPLAQRGATIAGSDISASMATEAGKRCEAAGIPAEQASFSTADLESLDGQHDTVTCIDVMIHYPSDKMVEMVSHLASKADRRLLISFAPKTPQYSFLKKVRARAARRARTRAQRRRPARSALSARARLRRHRSAGSSPDRPRRRARTCIRRKTCAPR